MIDSQIEVDDDPVAWLQAEVERLEAELRARDEILDQPIDHDHGHDDQAAREIDRLQGEISLRDETITQLWDHLQQREESAAAAQADWEQVQALIDDLETRLGGSPEALATATIPIAAADRSIAWDRERHQLNAEIERLRTQLQRADDSPPAPLARDENDHETTALRAEVARLRDDLERTADLESEVARLRARIRENEESRTVASPAEAAPTAGLGSAIPGAGLSPDERIRALRLHLREVHEKEVEERKSAQLATRLARLWQGLGR